jgi:hypothetical protein
MAEGLQAKLSHAARDRRRDECLPLSSASRAFSPPLYFGLWNIEGSVRVVFEFFEFQHFN